MSSMTEIWPDWEMAEVIGIGGWSRVYRAVLREHPEIQAAVKMIPAPDEEAEQILRGAQRMQQLSANRALSALRMRPYCRRKTARARS